jgi:extracellular elastinolytic metalloproteinase
VRQQHNDIKFANSVAHVAFSKSNKITAFGSNFIKPTKIASSSPTITKEKAISAAQAHLGGKYNGKPVGLEYVGYSHYFLSVKS